LGQEHLSGPVILPFSFHRAAHRGPVSLTQLSTRSATRDKANPTGVNPEPCSSRVGFYPLFQAYLQCSEFESAWARIVRSLPWPWLGRFSPINRSHLCPCRPPLSRHWSPSVCLLTRQAEASCAELLLGGGARASTTSYGAVTWAGADRKLPTPSPRVDWTAPQLLALHRLFLPP
jgi:hypothetical protein